jgi:hypothetical protein
LRKPSGFSDSVTGSCAARSASCHWVGAAIQVALGPLHVGITRQIAGKFDTPDLAV